MARALWKGAISFGLVNIPVELYPAEDHKTFKFAMLDKRDLTPVGYKRYSKTSGKEVEWEDIVKGYEYEKDRYVVLSDEDFRQANVKATQTIDIRAFVDDGEITPEYFESPYYLAPAARGEKVYALLRETLKSAGRVAVAQVVIRTQQHLAAVLPQGRALMLITLRYQDELRPAAGIDLPAGGLKAAGVAREGNRAREAAGRRHDRALEPGRVQGHLSRRPDGRGFAGRSSSDRPGKSRNRGRRRKARHDPRKSSISRIC